jgi:hypothetical protein
MSQRSDKTTMKPKHHWPFVKAISLTHALGETGLALLPSRWLVKYDRMGGRPEGVHERSSADAPTAEAHPADDGSD